jgi:hypothetical protein
MEVPESVQDNHLESIIESFKTPAVLNFSSTLSDFVERNLPNWGGTLYYKSFTDPQGDIHDLTGEPLSFVNSISGQFEPFFPLKPVSHPTWNEDHAKNAMSLVLAACLSYESDSITIAQLKHWGYHKIDTFACDSPLFNYNTNGFIASNDDHVIISFRGTETLKIIDWITDMNCTFVDSATGRVANIPGNEFVTNN